MADRDSDLLAPYLALLERKTPRPLTMLEMVRLLGIERYDRKALRAGLERAVASGQLRRIGKTRYQWRRESEPHADTPRRQPRRRADAAGDRRVPGRYTRVRAGFGFVEPLGRSSEAIGPRHPGPGGHGGRCAPRRRGQVEIVRRDPHRRRVVGRVAARHRSRARERHRHARAPRPALVAGAAERRSIRRCRSAVCHRPRAQEGMVGAGTAAARRRAHDRRHDRARARRRRRSRRAVSLHRLRARPAHRVSAAGPARGGARCRPIRDARDIAGAPRPARVAVRHHRRRDGARLRRRGLSRAAARRRRAPVGRDRRRLALRRARLGARRAKRRRAAPASTSPTAPSRCCRRSCRASCARSSRTATGWCWSPSCSTTATAARRGVRLLPRRHPQPRAADLHRRSRPCCPTPRRRRSAPGATSSPRCCRSSQRMRALMQQLYAAPAARRLARPRSARSADRSLRGRPQHRRALRAAQRRAPPDRGVHARGQPRRRRAPARATSSPFPTASTSRRSRTTSTSSTSSSGRSALHVDYEGRVAPRDVQRLLDRLQAHPPGARAVAPGAARAAAGALQHENAGHFGLAFPIYCHFTSPIRRYPDLLVHRQLGRAVRRRRGRGARRGRAPSRPPACSSSQAERDAMEAERAMLDLKKCEFMLDHLLEPEPATVVSVMTAGLFVELDAYPIEGLVRADASPATADTSSRRSARSKGCARGSAFASAIASWSRRRTSRCKGGRSISRWCAASARKFARRANARGASPTG